MQRRVLPVLFLDGAEQLSCHGSKSGQVISTFDDVVMWVFRRQPPDRSAIAKHLIYAVLGHPPTEVYEQSWRSFSR